jgi:hypothetical protein
MRNITFETEVRDIKTSEVKDDTCPMDGELEYNGREVKFKIVASSDNRSVLEELFGGVGHTVTFEIVDNAQTTLLDK